MPDLFLIDIQMPYMDGLTLCKYLKNKTVTTHIPVIIMSAQHAFESQAFEAGATAILQKPFDLKVASDLIRKILG